MKTYSQLTTESRRLAVLKLLLESAGSANESVLHHALTSLLGFPLTSREDLRADLDWMRERRLILVDRLPSGDDRVLMIAKITQDGVDAALGRGQPIDGLARPTIAG